MVFIENIASERYFPLPDKEARLAAAETGRIQARLARYIKENPVGRNSSRSFMEAVKRVQNAAYAREFPPPENRIHMILYM